MIDGENSGRFDGALIAAEACDFDGNNPSHGVRRNYVPIEIKMFSSGNVAAKASDMPLVHKLRSLLHHGKI